MDELKNKGLSLVIMNIEHYEVKYRPKQRVVWRPSEDVTNASDYNVYDKTGKRKEASRIFYLINHGFAEKVFTGEKNFKMKLTEKGERARQMIKEGHKF